VQAQGVISPLTASLAPGRSAYISAPPSLLFTPLLFDDVSNFFSPAGARPEGAFARHRPSPR
jgi:hypothetical protein